MLFSLTNLKRRSVRDPDGEMAVVPKLLHGRNALKLLEQAIEVFDGYVGRPRSEYDSRALEAVMSDYRLARCVRGVLAHAVRLRAAWRWAACCLRRMVSPCGARASDVLADEVGGVGRGQCRFGGFVPPLEHEGFMERLAAEWGIGRGEVIDRLLVLDSDASAVLTLTSEKPRAREIMRQYNRGAVQTLLAHSSRVTFNLSSVPGAALKRVYFLAKRRGVLVEVEGAPGGTCSRCSGRSRRSGPRISTGSGWRRCR